MARELAKDGTTEVFLGAALRCCLQSWPSATQLFGVRIKQLSDPSEMETEASEAASVFSAGREREGERERARERERESERARDREKKKYTERARDRDILSSFG